MTDTIVVKINVVKLGVTKTFRFLPMDRVDHIIQHVQEKTAGTQPKPNENFGIFRFDPYNEKKSFWMLNSRTLKFYDIENNDTLQYKDKNRYLKVKMLDKTIKTVLVDDSKSVGHALDIICEKIGITNADEFALFIEEDKTDEEEEKRVENADKPNKTNTLRRVSGALMNRVENIEQRRVEKLKEKAHTDDDTNWLSNDKSLRECGVHDDTLVVIRRRFMYEQSVNITNPIEIALLYAQSTAAILDGSHPCDVGQAATFAAYMIQVQHGDYDEMRYKTNYIEPREYLPKEYQKNKEVKSKIKEEHKKLKGLSDLDAKYKYIQLCQNLKTYGVTFFLVKEKVKGKNKLQPCLFGVCKESVMRVDERSKRIVKEWPLTTIKNWAASPNSFTLDFGSYTEGMYSVQTLEGPQIGQLIGGYIDIILKRTKNIKQRGIRDDELGIIDEGVVHPGRRHVIQPNNFRDNQVVMPTQRRIGNVSSQGMTAIQQQLIDNIDNSGRAMLVVMDDLVDEEEEENPYAELEPIRQAHSDDFRVDNTLADISVALTSIASATASPPEELDYEALNGGINRITSNMTNLARHLKYNAKPNTAEDEGKGLLDAAKNLSDSFKFLLSRLDPQKQMTYEEAFDAMNLMADASVSIESVLKKKSPDAILRGLVKGAKEIENATTIMAEKARQLASTLDDNSLNKIHTAAKHAILKAQSMVVAAKVMAPYLHRPDATEQFSSSIRALSKDIKALSSMCHVSTDDEESRALVDEAAKHVTEELATMLSLVQNGAIADLILVANAEMMNFIGNPDEMKELATLFDQAYSRIVDGVRANAEALDENDKSNLLDAAKRLSDLMKLELSVGQDPSDILDTIGKAAEANLEIDRILNKNNPAAELQKALLALVDEIHEGVKALDSDARAIAMVSNNQTAARIMEAGDRVMLRSTAMITAAKVLAPYIENPEAVDQMVNAAKLLSQDIKQLTQLCNDLATDDHERDKIDNAAHSIVEGIAKMLKLFQEGVVPEKIPDLMLSINEKFLKSLGDPEDMRRQMARFEKPYIRLLEKVPEMAEGMKEDDKNKLLEAAKALSDALKIPITVGNTPDEVLDKLEKLSEAAIVVENLSKVNKAPVVMQRALLKSSEDIERSYRNLDEASQKVLPEADAEKATKIRITCRRNRVKARSLVVTTKVLSPYVKNSESVEQINNFMKAFSKDVISLRDMAEDATDDDDLKTTLHAAAQGVTTALNDMLKITQNMGKAPVQNVVERDIFKVILEAHDKLMRAYGKPDQMVKQATILGQVYSQLIRTMQAKSDLLVDSDEKENLLAAAAELSDATTELLAAAKRVKDNPTSKAEQDKLKAASMHLRLITNSTTDNALKKAMAAKLELCAKQASAAMTRLIGIGHHVAPYNTSPAKQKEFVATSEKMIVNEGKKLIHAVKEDEQKQGSPQALQQLINACKAFVQPSNEVIKLAHGNARFVANGQESQNFDHAANVAQTMVDALGVAAEKASGEQEDLDRAVNIIHMAINDLDQAVLASMSDNLKPSTNDSIKQLEEKITNNCNKIKDEIPDTVQYAMEEPDKVGESVVKLADFITPLCENAVAFAANLPGQQQVDTLNLAKTVFESAELLINASRHTCATNETEHDNQLQDAADNLVQALKDLLHFTKATTNDIDAIDYLVTSFDNVKSEEFYKEAVAPTDKKSFVGYQERMIKFLKAISRDAHDMVGKAQTDPKELAPLAENLYEDYSELADDTRNAVRMINPEVGEALRGNVQALGDSCKVLVQSAGNFQASPENYLAKKDLADNAKDVSVKVAQVMSVLQKGSVGTQACISAISTLSGLIGDIDTTVMFADAGTLDPEDEQSFGAHRETILWSSQKLVKDTKQLVEAAHKTQDHLAGAVKEVLKSNTTLIKSVKIGAASLGPDDMNGQILLLNSVKDVTTALSDLINHTKTTSGHVNDDTSNDNLKSSAKHMVGTLTALLKTVRSVEDEASRGARALESTMEAIKQAVISYNPDDSTKIFNPEDLVRATKGVTVATAKAVAAANSVRQADIIEAANIGRKQCIELIDTSKGAIITCDNDEVKRAIIVKVKETLQAYCGVLDHILGVVTKVVDGSDKTQFANLSKKVATSVADLVKASEQLKGTDLVNPEDPNVIAENELLGAAASIEAAARKLADLKPRERPREADESLNFEEQILEAARSITAAAGALVKAATVAQRELVSTGKVCSPDSDVYADTQWSQGLISAARMVAEATSALCEAANAAVQGNASQEKLIASAQAVSASTAQLLLACRVKADPNSKAQRGLQHAGTAVKRASDSLVTAAQESAFFNDEVDNPSVYKVANDSKHQMFKDELMAQEAILKQEKALEKARKKLEAIRVARYHHDQREEDEEVITQNEA
eukprot:TCONS_00021443-protein